MHPHPHKTAQKAVAGLGCVQGIRTRIMEPRRVKQEQNYFPERLLGSAEEECPLCNYP